MFENVGVNWVWVVSFLRVRIMCLFGMRVEWSGSYILVCYSFIGNSFYFCGFRFLWLVFVLCTFFGVGVMIIVWVFGYCGCFMMVVVLGFFLGRLVFLGELM